jgi:predicted GH43/DUF377 family glycosyl hydrolase
MPTKAETENSMPKVLSPAPLEVKRLSMKLEHDIRRVITRLFSFGGTDRKWRVFERVAGLDVSEVRATLEKVRADFTSRHIRLEEIFEKHYHIVAMQVGWNEEPDLERRLLIGSYFTMEYSIEAAALFNPSMAAHPDQTGLPEDALRFVMSLRATGEGHVSSVVFRTGVIDRFERILLDPAPRFSAAVQRAPDMFYHKDLFRRKLNEVTGNAASMDMIMNQLPEQFTYDQLNECILGCRDVEFKPSRFNETTDSMLWLARSNYSLEIEESADISDIVIFPSSESEVQGIEDLRLVQFADDDGATTYYGTFTAFNGVRILPMLLETKDFKHIEVHTLNGACARNKGMALFPRKIGGHYVMSSRIDGQSLYIMYSDMVHFWESAEKVACPLWPWEMVIMGNCGSPIETEEGWLLITHGVGPMRRYCLGAMLLDLEDPTKILGRLREPLLAPSEEEREGYTPNVVYSCGSIAHNGRLYIPYAMSDQATSAASVDMDDLINLLLDSPAP